MIIKYFIVEHLGTKRRYVKNDLKRMWLMKLTKHSTITDVDYQALQVLGAKLIEVKPPKGAK